MQSSRLGLVGRLVLALLAVLMLGALVASAAQAANEPTRALEWKVGGKVLKANETRELTIKNYTREIVLTAPTQKINVICEEASVSSGSFIANENGQAVSESNAVFSKCKVEGNGTPCSVTEPITTKKIKSEFVLNDLKPGIGSTILVLFFPTAGTEKEFVELKFEGSGCKFKNTIVKNTVLGLLWTDPKVGTGALEEVELGKLPAETTSYLIKFPDPEKGNSKGELSTWLWNGSAFKLVELKTLVAFSEEVTLTGTLLVLLSGGGSFGLTETGK